MPHTTTHLIERFYSAFQKRDAAGMAACYAPDVKFGDEELTESSPSA